MKITNKNFKKIFFNFSINAMRLFSIALLLLLLIVRLIVKCHITLDQNEKTIFSSNSILFYILLPISIITIIYTKKFIAQIPAKYLILFFSSIYIITGIFLIINITSSLRADANYVYEIAKEINKGNFKGLSFGEYIFRYPHQIGLLTYNRILSIFSKSPKILFLLNLIWTLTINYFIYKISLLWFDENESIAKITIILSYLFLPQFFFILFAYGTLPGFCCLVIALYYGSKLLLAQNKPLYVALFLLFSSLSILLKNNYLIGVLAMLIIGLLYYLKKKTNKILIVLTLLIFTFFVPQTLLKTFYEIESGYSLDNGEPKLLWVAMGMQESPSCNGWYNAFNQYTYTTTNFNEKESNKIAKIEIKNRLNQFKTNPIYASKFYSAKIISTWNDPMYQSVWSGPLPSLGQNVNTKLLNNIYNDGSLYTALELLSNIITFNIMLFTIIYLMFNFNKKDLLPIFSLIFFIGGFLFHIIWETKSQYVYMYIFCLIPLAANGITYAHTYISNKINSIKTSKSVQN